MPWRLTGMLRVGGFLNLGIVALSLLAMFYGPLIWAAIAMLAVAVPLAVTYAVRSMRDIREARRRSDQLAEEIEALDRLIVERIEAREEKNDD